MKTKKQPKINGVDAMQFNFALSKLRSEIDEMQREYLHFTKRFQFHLQMVSDFAAIVFPLSPKPQKKKGKKK